MKKFVNDPANFVHEMTEGLVLANSDSGINVPQYIYLIIQQF